MRLQSDVAHGYRNLAMVPFFPRPACPHCGDTMFAATATEYNGRGGIQYFWSCESCHHEFTTAVDMPSSER
jgi:transposase-like protein